jgi:hypothetical protein
MSMLVYKPHLADSRTFVDFWSSQYPYPEELYDDNIGLELNEKRVFDLFQWKNGTPLSRLKQASVRKNFVRHKAELARLQTGESAADLLAHIPDGGAIWRIFFLHCCQPTRFPIYDQHVHRAMVFIQTGSPEEIPAYDAQKIMSYCQRYLPFYATFDGIDHHRSVDKALWNFGKFLKEATFPTKV